MSVRHMTLTAMLTALLCIAGPLTLPLGPLPFTLTTAALMFCALLLGPGRAVLCCALYLLIGLTGLPVFSGFTGGAGVFFGPTGGFLLGYLPMTWLCALTFARTDKRALQLAGCLAGLMALYLPGAAWYAWQSGVSPGAAAAAVLPFLPGDAVKLALILTGGQALKARLKKAARL